MTNQITLIETLTPEIINQSSGNLLITGRAGSGKSTLLSQYVHTIKKTKKVAVLAPTGIAALNVGGQTIHRFFRINPARPMDRPPKALRDILRALEVLVIDEISMARADLIDQIDGRLRQARENNQPFGGVRMIFFGDPYQLPPVVRREEIKTFQNKWKTPFFFGARAFAEGQFQTFVMTKVYRQTDPVFINVLEEVRQGRLTPSGLNALNARHRAELDDQEFLVTLSGTNADAAVINRAKLDALPGSVVTYQAKITGDFSSGAVTAPECLELKPEAQVMLLTNDPANRWVNGTMAKVILPISDKAVLVETENGKRVIVEPHTWRLERPVEKNGKIKSITSGTFTQLPMTLAWAVTVHKSQGKTFERMRLSLSDAFAPGQFYVALSRARSLEGLTLDYRARREMAFASEDVILFFDNPEAFRPDPRPEDQYAYADVNLELF